MRLRSIVFLCFCFGFVKSDGSSRFEELRVCLLGSAVHPEHIIGRTANATQYEDLNYQWQQHGGQLHPLGYLQPDSTAEVQSAVRCARKFNISVIPKSGGHSYGKYSFGDYKKKEKDEFTIVLDLQLMNRVQRINGTNRAVVGPGTLTGHLAWKVWLAGEMLLPIGICPTVGIAGLALGGGHGYLSRTYGLMMDNILEMEVVNSNGSVVIANDVTNKDLFWAIRGAGGGSLGIVTNFLFKIHQAPAQVIYMINTYELSEFSNVFDAWQLFVKTNSRNSISTALHVKDNAIYLEVVAFQEAAYGPDADFVVKLFNFSFPAPPMTPTANNKTRVSIEYFTYPEFLLKMAHQFGMITKPAINEYADILGVSHHSFGQSYMRAKSFYGKTLVQDKRDLQEMAKLVKDLPPKTVLYYLSYGGVVNDIDANETSFIHRGQDILYHCEMVQYGTLEDDKTDFPWLEKFFQITKRIMRHNESYQNYVDDVLEDHLPRYYGTNLPRLIQIKSKYDPDNYFRTPMSIPMRMEDGSATAGTVAKPVTSNALGLGEGELLVNPSMGTGTGGGEPNPKPLTSNGVANSGTGANFILFLVPIFAAHII